jgi:hypothetical protein
VQGRLRSIALRKSRDIQSSLRVGLVAETVDTSQLQRSVTKGSHVKKNQKIGSSPFPFI